MKKVIGMLAAFGFASASMAAPEAIEVEVTFMDHWGKASETIHVAVPVNAPADKSVVNVPNPARPTVDLLKLAVAQPDDNDKVVLLAEERADKRVVGARTYTNSTDPSQKIQAAKLEDMHAFEPRAVGVGDQFKLVDGGEVLSIVRRVR